MDSVLVVAAHPDDEVLGCGGTIARHTAAGDAVDVLILAQGVMARPHATQAHLDALRDAARRASRELGVRDLTLHDFPDNRLDSVGRLEVTRAIEAEMERRKPSIVYTHHWADVNVDHRIINECVLAACRPVPSSPVRRLLFFEVPSSTEWSGPQHEFAPSWFVDIAATLERKLQALRAYAAELRAFPHPRSIEAVRNLALWRGASAGMHAAEAFVLARGRE